MILKLKLSVESKWLRDMRASLLLCFSTLFPHCFSQRRGILVSLWCNNFRGVYQELGQGNFYSFDEKKKNENKNLPRSHVYLTDS